MDPNGKSADSALRESSRKAILFSAILLTGGAAALAISTLSEEVTVGMSFIATGILTGILGAFLTGGSPSLGRYAWGMHTPDRYAERTAAEIRKKAKSADPDIFLWLAAAGIFLAVGILLLNL